jgi:hypothetical protein
MEAYSSSDGTLRPGIETTATLRGKYVFAKPWCRSDIRLMLPAVQKIAIYEEFR